MVCIYCHGKTQVVNSRLQRRANNIWRRRQCLDCASIFTTHECIELQSAIAVQSPDSTDIDNFCRDNLFISIYQSCGHRKNAITDSDALTQTVLDKIIKTTSKGIIHKSQIAELVFETLEKFDKAAATIYRAYHPPR